MKLLSQWHQRKNQHFLQNNWTWLLKSNLSPATRYEQDAHYKQVKRRADATEVSDVKTNLQQLTTSWHIHLTSRCVISDRLPLLETRKEMQQL